MNHSWNNFTKKSFDFNRDLNPRLKCQPGWSELLFASSRGCRGANSWMVVTFRVQASWKVVHSVGAVRAEQHLCRDSLPVVTFIEVILVTAAELSISIMCKQVVLLCRWFLSGRITCSVKMWPTVTDVKVRVSFVMDIAVHIVTSPHATGIHVPCGITQYYLPPDWGDISVVSVCVSVCRSVFVTTVSRTEVVESIKMPFGAWSRVCLTMYCGV